MRSTVRSLFLATLVVLVTGCAPATDEGPDDGRTTTDDASVDPTVAPTVPPLLGGEDGIDHWPETLVTAEAADGDLLVAAKVADIPERRRQGLMRVPELPDDVGMLFLLEEERTGGFWMKDTLVPLDIAYLAGGEVVAILQMDPCEADPCPSYDPGALYDAALEVRQGLFEEAGVEVGAAVTWTPPSEPPS